MKWLSIILLIYCNLSFAQTNRVIDGAKELIQISQFDSAIVILNLGINNCIDCSKTDLGYLYLSRGKANQYNSEYESAVSDYFNALQNFNLDNNLEGTATAYITIAEYHRYQANYKKAFNYIHKAIEINRFSPLPKEKLAQLYNRYAAITNESAGDQFKVIEYSELAISLSSDLELKASSLREIGSIYEVLDKPLAIKYYNEALGIYQSIDNKLYIAEMMFTIARYYYYSHEYNNAINYCNKGLKISRPNNWDRVTRDLLHFKYKSYKKLNDYKSASIAMEEHFKIAHTISKQQWDQNLKTVESKNLLQDKDIQIEIERRKADQLLFESNQKAQELKFIIIFTVLLIITLSISLFAYFKIKKKNKTIQKSLKQKEILVQEVHHRVKNNLTFLNSLLYLRSKATDNKQIIDVLQECQSRVQTMSIVHQNLYDVKDASKVEFDTFLTQLSDETKTLLNYDSGSLQIITNTSGISFEMGFTVFLGLILNEFITNSIKHGVNNSEASSISINLSNKNEVYTLTYTDSGKGLPKDFVLNSSGGFGFKLINLLIDQIDATLKYEYSTKKFIIQFKL